MSRAAVAGLAHGRGGRLAFWQLHEGERTRLSPISPTWFLRGGSLTVFYRLLAGCA
jgi:hypothetical protein